MKKIYIFTTFFFSLIGIIIWLTFIKPVPQQTGFGNITAKTFQPSYTKTAKYTSGDKYHSTNQINTTVPDGYIFKIQIEGKEERKN